MRVAFPPSMSPRSPLAAAVLVGVVFHAALANAAPWLSIGPEYGGEIRILRVDPATPETMYASAGPLLYKTTDAARTWTVVDGGLDGGGVGDLVIDPWDPTTLYASVPDAAAVYKTVDGGAHWTRGGGLEGVRIAELALDPTPPGTLYGASQDSSGLVVTRNGGASWGPIAVLAGRRIFHVTVDPGHPGTVYAAGDGVVFKSTDAGATWTSVPGAADFGILVDPTDGTRLWALSYGRGTDGVSVSTDAGATWTPVNVDGITDPYTIGIYASPLDPGAVYVITNGKGIFRRAPGAGTWAHATAGLPNQLTRSIVLASPERLFVGILGGVFEHGEAGSWLARNHGFSNAYVQALTLHPEDPSTVYASTLYSTELLASTDRGDSWTPLPTGFSSPVEKLVIEPATPARFFAKTYYTLYLSEDGGTTWRDWSNGLRDPEFNDSVDDFALAPSRPATMYARTWRGVFRSIDGGASWEPTNPGPAGIGALGNLVVDPYDPDTVYAASMGLLKTTDGGESWTRYEDGLPYLSEVWSMLLDPTNPATVYAVASSFTQGTSLVKSLDGGRSWTTLAGAPSSVSVLAFDPRDSRRLYAAAFDGAWKSSDAGATWTRFGASRSGSHFLDLVVHPKAPRTAYASVFGHGVHRLTFEPPGAFQCYGVGRAAPLDAPAALANALEPSFGALVRAPRQLCMPAAVDDDDRTAPPDAARLVGYEVHGVAPAPAPRALRVTNRLGSSDVRTGVIDLLAVHATETDAARSDGLLGDFTCYRTRGGRMREKNIVLADRFGAVHADLKGPVRVCVRTEVNGTGRGEDDADLACYALRVRDGVATPASIAMIDPFGPVTLRPRASRRLCVRSTVAPAPLPVASPPVAPP